MGAGAPWRIRRLTHLFLPVLKSSSKEEDRSMAAFIPPRRAIEEK
jgi:hypothetical protein